MQTSQNKPLLTRHVEPLCRKVSTLSSRCVIANCLLVCPMLLQIGCRRFNLAAFQGFTYVAPSVLDSMSDMQRSSEFRPRSVRRPRVGSLVRGASGSLQMAPGQVGKPHPYQDKLANSTDIFPMIGYGLWKQATIDSWSLPDRVVRPEVYWALVRKGSLFKEDLASQAAKDSPPSTLSLRAWRLERSPHLLIFFLP